MQGSPAGGSISDTALMVGLADFMGRRVSYVIGRIRSIRLWELELPQLIAILLVGTASDAVWRLSGGPSPAAFASEWHKTAIDKRDALIVLALDEVAQSIANPRTQARVRAVLAQAAAQRAELLDRDSVGRSTPRAPKQSASAGPMRDRSGELMARTVRLLRKAKRERWPIGVCALPDERLRVLHHHRPDRGKPHDGTTMLGNEGKTAREPIEGSLDRFWVLA